MNLQLTKLRISQKYLPIALGILVILLVFRKFIFLNLLPVPTDILTGAYYPWLDYKWGYSVGVPVKNPALSDVISIIYPWRSLGISQLKAGRLPLWDNSSLLGTPLLANFQSGITNPLNLLFFIFDNASAWSLQVMAQSIFSFIFFYLFVRNLKISRGSSVLGALIYSFCGYSLVWLEYNTIGFACSVIPLVFWCADKLTNSKNPTIIAFILSVVVCFQILAGYPQLVLYTIPLAFIYLIYRLRSRSISGVPVVWFIISIVSGLLFSAFQLFPSLELNNLSMRRYDTVVTDSHIQFLPLKSVFTFFIPDLYGNPGSGNYWGPGTYDNFAFSIFSVGAFFLLISVFSKDAFSKRNLIFLIIIVIGILAATDNPLNRQFVNLNLFGLKAAVATRVLIFVDFSAAVLTASTLDYLIKAKIKKLYYAVLPLSVNLGILIGIIISLRIISNLISPEISAVLPDIVKLTANLKISVKNMFLPLGIDFVLAILTFALICKRRIYIFCVMILILTEIYWNTSKYLPFTPRVLFYPSTPATDILKVQIPTGRFDREDAEILPSNTWAPYGLVSAVGQNAIYPLKTSKLFSLINGNYPQVANRFVNGLNNHSDLYPILGIENLIVINRDPKLAFPTPTGIPFGKFQNDTRLSEIANINSIRIYHYKEPAGLVWFTSNTDCYQTEAGAVLQISTNNYDPLVTSAVKCTTPLADIPKGSAIVSKYLPGYYSITVDNPKENYLLISESNFPGWSAVIDGVAAPIHDSYLALMAVLVPAGKHQIILNYQPRSFYWGAAVSLASLVLWGIILLVVKYRRLTTHKLAIIR